MDANTLNRREKRHYRKIVDGEIVYSSSPIDEISNNPTSSSKTKIEKILPANVSVDKKELINKVLDDMSEVINPDLDNIADMIYDELKDNNIDVEKQVVKSTVSKHYRASSINRVRSNTIEKQIEDESDVIVDRDKLKLIVDDLFVQIEKENKIEELTKAKNKELSEKIKKDKEKEIEKPKSKETSKSKEQTTKKNDISKLLIEDDSDLLDNEEDDSDDLGLKF